MSKANTDISFPGPMGTFQDPSAEIFYAFDEKITRSYKRIITTRPPPGTSCQVFQKERLYLGSYFRV